jgi:hypothetical protein
MDELALAAGDEAGGGVVDEVELGVPLLLHAASTAVSAAAPITPHACR